MSPCRNVLVTVQEECGTLANSSLVWFVPIIIIGKDVEAGDAGANEAAQTKIRGGEVLWAKLLMLLSLFLESRPRR